MLRQDPSYIFSSCIVYCRDLLYLFIEWCRSYVLVQLQFSFFRHNRNNNRNVFISRKVPPPALYFLLFIFRATSTALSRSTMLLATNMVNASSGSISTSISGPKDIVQPKQSQRFYSQSMTMHQCKLSIYMYFIIVNTSQHHDVHPRQAFVAS